MQTYHITDIVNTPAHTSLHVGIFEETPDPEGIEWPHRHSYYAIVWFCEGSGFNTIDFEAFQILPYRLFLMNPHQVHNWEYSTDTKGFFAGFTPALAKELHITFSMPYVDIPQEDTLFIRTIFTKLQQETDTQRQYIALSYLFSLIEKQMSPQREALPSLVKQYQQLLSQHLGNRISIQQYAEWLQISAETLNVLCKSHTGLSAKQLALSVTLTEAQRLLLYTSLTINEIAYRLSFDDPSYFTRLFREKTNLTPSAFREKYRTNL
ncbi:AraC family transcriptional regulator [Capnocytophaga sp. HP1101]